jgi:NodT family efflux transporter outer membrane factor (OMF) lipoprotein
MTASATSEWWRSFGSAELDGLMVKGLGANFNLAVAYSKVEQARGGAQIAGANRYPSVGIAAATGQGKPTVLGQASYEVDFWGKNRASAQSANALVNASEFDAHTIRITLGALIADTYFQILSLDDRLRLAQVIASDAQRVLDLVATRTNLGASSQLEVAQQRNQVQTFQAAVPALQQQRDQALYQLAVLLGLAPQGFQIEGSGLDRIAAPQVQVETPVTVLSRRPDIAAAEARLKSANFDIGVARSLFMPSVNLSTLVELATQPMSTVVGLVGTLPLFSGGRLEGALRVSRAHAQELVATYRETIIEALQDVEGQLTAIKQLDQVNVLDTAAVASAREAARLARVRLDLGVIDFQTLLTTERTLYQAEDTLLQVKLQRLQAAVGLYRALGEDINE